MSYISLMEHTCYLVTKASSQNYLGEWTYTWTDSTSKTDCRMSPLTASERIEAQGRFDDVSFRGFFKSGTSITVDNRIKYRNKHYVVKEMSYDSNFHHITTLLREL